MVYKPTFLTPAEGGLGHSTTATSGTILRGDGTNWTQTTATFPNTAGTSGNVLTSDGTNFASSAPAWILLQTQNPSSVATVTFNSTVITSTYQTYMLIFNSILSSGSTLNMTISTDNGSTYLSANYHSGCMFNAYNAATWTNQNSTALFQLITGMSATNESAGKLFLYGAGQAKQFCCEGDFSVANTYWQKGHGSNTGTTAINNIKFSLNAGTISGTISLYGLKQ